MRFGTTARALSRISSDINEVLRGCAAWRMKEYFGLRNVNGAKLMFGEDYGVVLRSKLGREQPPSYASKLPGRIPSVIC